MKKQILATSENKAFLAKAFGCTPMTVWRALNFERDNELARKIRHLALQRGGRITGGDEELEMDFETIHDTANGRMIQRFGRRVQIVVDRKNAEVTVYVDDEAKEMYSNLTIPEFIKLQGKVYRMAKVL